MADWEDEFKRKPGTPLSPRESAPVTWEDEFKPVKKEKKSLEARENSFVDALKKQIAPYTKKIGDFNNTYIEPHAEKIFGRVPREGDSDFQSFKEDFQRRTAGPSNAFMKGVPMVRQGITDNPFQQQYEKENPSTTLLAKIAGGTAATLPMMGSLPVAAAGGFLTGAADKAIELGDPTDSASKWEIAKAGGKDALLNVLGVGATRLLSPGAPYKSMGETTGKRAYEETLIEAGKMSPREAGLGLKTHPIIEKILEKSSQSGRDAFIGGLAGHLAFPGMGAIPGALLGALVPYSKDIVTKGVPAYYHNTVALTPLIKEMLRSLPGSVNRATDELQ